MKKYLSIALSIILALSLCACGSVKTREMPAEAAMNEYAMTEECKAYDYAPAPAAMSGSGIKAQYNDAYDTYDASVETVELSEVNPDKIIYSADATVETTTFDDTVNMIDELIEKYKAWVESSSISGANYYDISRGRDSNRNAYYTIRIPSESFDEVMSGLNGLGNVPYSRIYTENVTAQYYDTQARLDSLKTQEQSLLRLMEKAENVEDIITIEEKLSDVRYNIESLQATLNNWDRQVMYSYLYLTVNEVEEYTPEKLVNPGFGEKFVQAIKDGFDAAGDLLSGLAIWFAQSLPTIALIAAVLFALFMPVRASIRRKKAKKASKTAQEEKK